MVNLDRIYTRGGDAGETSLGDGARVPKSDLRIEAYGTIDELGAVLGVARTSSCPSGWTAGSAVSRTISSTWAPISRCPRRSAPTGPPTRARTRLRIEPEQVLWLEQRCDEVNDGLEPLRSFVLSGGTPTAAQLHLARTVARRAERVMVRLAARETINPQTLAYINRLSDLLFILARAANPPDGEVLWVPGGER